MKSHLLTATLALLALCSALTLPAATRPASPGRLAAEIPLAEVPARVNANGDTVTTGTSRVMVSLRLGVPDVTLSDGTWLFNNYTAKSDRGRSKTGALVVRFKSSKVSSITLADEATVVALRQERQAPDRNQTLAASNSR